MNGSFVEVTVSPDGAVAFISHGGYESRNQSVTLLCKSAFELVEPTKIRGKSFFISTDDIACSVTGKVTFGFTRSENVIVCPDFTFDKWIECGIDDYERTTSMILVNSQEPPVSEKLFWIGNPRTQELRFKLISLGIQNAERLRIIPMNWLRDYSKGHKHRFTHYVSLEDHTKYKYLIDCGAAGFSGRLKFLLHSNRTLFLVDRQQNNREYFYDQLVPYEHFIPVAEHLHDLLAKITWADNHPSEAQQIAKNAKEFAIQYLSRRAAVEYFAKAIIENI
ncbi:Glycosyl transferase family 90 [Dyadobacter sp. SG02]|uniref:glycosyl transferase family 90 n=1 Tax=Dyadobacter sp. SG02 TaxID=1855291 RepID=UPI0008B5F411|nr:glycosyl transferase family 90 [Dyadobacter sp. SG02]SEJ75805.1 Glycosyl transferase family 90 [Dyadobacter sp. SG02]